MSSDGRARSEGRLTALGVGSWNNRGIDNHIKRPAGVSSCGLKRMGNKRMDDLVCPTGCGNTSKNMVDSLKYPDECLVNNEHIYDAGCVRHFTDANFDPHDANLPTAGVEGWKTVKYLNYQALSDPERDGPEGGKPPSWLVEQKLKRHVQLYRGNGDPVRHDHVMPHKVGTRPIRRMGPSGNSGPVYNNGAAKLNWNLQQQQLHTGPLDHKDLKPSDWKAVGQRLQVSALGEVVYNVGGREDLRPACTVEYTKADKPVSRLTQYENDKVLLRHDRVLERHSPTTRNQESKDMVAAMCGQGDRTPSAAASCLDDAGPWRPELSSQAETRAPSEYSRDPARELRPSVPQPQSYVESQGSRPDSRRSPASQSFESWRDDQRSASNGGRDQKGGRDQIGASTLNRRRIPDEQNGRRPQSARGPDRRGTPNKQGYRSQTASSVGSSYLGPEGSQVPSSQALSGRNDYNRQAKERAPKQAPKVSNIKPSARPSDRRSPRAPLDRPLTAR